MQVKKIIESLNEAEKMIIIFSGGYEGDLIAAALLKGDQYIAIQSLAEKGILKTCDFPGMLKVTKVFEKIRDELRKDFKIEFTL